MISCPADVIAIALAWAFALACFLCGVILASDLNSKPRWLAFGLCFLMAAALAEITWHSLVPINIAIETVFAITNGVLGFKAGKSVVHQRLRIFGALSIWYSLGLVLGPLGVILLTVPIVLVTNRNVASDAR